MSVKVRSGSIRRDHSATALRLSQALGEQAGNDPFRAYMERARARWLQGQTASVAEIRTIYYRTAREVSRDIARYLPTQPSARHLGGIRTALDEAATHLSEESLRATLDGIQIAHGAGVSGAEAVAHRLLGSAFASGGIRAMYHAINQRAVLAYATRTRFDGLRLSERVWRNGNQVRQEVGRVVEHAVARGLDSRKVALEVQQFLDPNTVTPHKPGVRSRLGISKSVDYRAMRLARTEIGNAFREGTVLGHRNTPSYLGSRWELSGGHPFTDDCDDLAGGGDGPDGIYLPGHEPLSPHPNCMCVLSPVHESIEQFSERLARWRTDPNGDAELEDWFQNRARPYLGRPGATTKAPAKVGAPTAATQSGTTMAHATSLPSPVKTQMQTSATAPTEAGASSAAKKAEAVADDVIEELDPQAFRSKLHEELSDDLERVRRQRELVDREANWSGLEGAPRASLQARAQVAPTRSNPAGSLPTQSVDELLTDVKRVGSRLRKELDERLARAKGYAAKEKKLAETRATFREAEERALALRSRINELRASRTGLDPWGARYREITEQVSEVIDEYNGIVNTLGSLQKADMRAAEAVAKIRRTEIRGLLDEVREMGLQGKSPREWGVAHNRGSTVAKRADELDDALSSELDLFPTEWLQQNLDTLPLARATRPQIGVTAGELQPLIVQHTTKSRLRGALGTYNGDDVLLHVSGSGAQMRNTLLHELTHRMQHAVGGIEGSPGSYQSILMRLDQRFRLARANPGEVPRANAAYGMRDWIEDKFSDDYFGALGNSGTGRSELSTRLMESLWNARYDIDDELTDYGLGILAAL